MALNNISKYEGFRNSNAYLALLFFEYFLYMTQKKAVFVWTRNLCSSRIVGTSNEIAVMIRGGLYGTRSRYNAYSSTAVPQVKQH